MLMQENYSDLEQKIDELVQLCAQLDKENNLLRSRESEWRQERKRLIEKNELARSKVEAMITRLKTMEQDA